MRHSEYLRRLKKTAREHKLVPATPVLPEARRSPEAEQKIQSAIATIMRQIGFSDEKIATRFGNVPPPLSDDHEQRPKRFG